jgi:hypothetical protein
MCSKVMMMNWFAGDAARSRRSPAARNADPGGLATWAMPSLVPRR